jgi:hypothetical protein
VFVRVLVFCTGVVWSMASAACGVDDQNLCKRRFEQLIAHRAAAIQGAFGDPFMLPDKIGVQFFFAEDPNYGHLYRRVAYDPERRVIVVSRSLMHSKFPNPLGSAAYYWPFYENGRYRDDLKIVGQIDNALWTAFLQESARARGLSWPHEACESTDVGRRLPCEMVLSGVVEHLTTIRLPIFNENRLDRIWPDDYARFSSTVWLQDDAYVDVKRYGGILLVKPLIAEFGVLRAMAYVAQTPFEVRESSLRAAALRYQREARNVLSAQVPARGEPVANLSAITDVVISSRNAVAETSVSAVARAGTSLPRNHAAFSASYR